MKSLMRIESDARVWHAEDDSSSPHREGGPAVEMANGTKAWFFRGLQHREGAPAIEHAGLSGGSWYVHGKRHRVRGPAVTRLGGIKQWYRHGKMIAETIPDASPRLRESRARS